MPRPLKQAGFNRGASKQDYQTDPLFMKAVVKRFGSMNHDLAATKENSQCGQDFYGPGSKWAEDSLAIHWTSAFGSSAPNLWLNPPYDDIPTWAKKCSEYKGTGSIFFLVPASVGSNWFAELVNPYAYTYILNGRLTFVGQKDPYPKDCMLAVFGARYGGRIEIWRWKWIETPGGPLHVDAFKL